MSVQLTGIRVFFASPGGLDEERRKFREFLLQLNEDDAIERGIVFIPVRWEETLQGVGRPQEKINKDLQTADYLVLVLWDRWGTPPDEEGDHTSGTEEEYGLASALLADDSAPMKDIIVLFKGVDDRQLSDPGEQLRKVLDFKSSLEESRSLLYGTFDSIEEFERHLLKHLLAWMRAGDSKEAREAPTVTPSKARDDSDTIPPGGDLLELAERYADEERDADAERIFAKIVTARPSIESLRKYARFLRRKGRTAHSRSVTEQLLEFANSMDSDAGRVYALTNLGLLDRKSGNLQESERHFREAIAIARGSRELSEQTRLSYIYDNLGHTLRRLGKSDEALEAHQAALKFRQATGDTRHLGHTFNNLGALQRRYGRYPEAKATLDQALELFEESGDVVGRASVLANLGLLSETLGDYDEARRQFEESYELNTAHGSSDGMSMNLSQLSRMSIHFGDLIQARKYAEECLKINRRGGNQEGIGTGLQHVAKVSLAEHEFDEAAHSIELSLEVFRTIPHQLGIAGALTDRARVHRALNELVEARAALDEADRIAVELDEVPLLEEIRSLRRDLGQ